MAVMSSPLFTLSPFPPSSVPLSSPRRLPVSRCSSSSSPSASFHMDPQNGGRDLFMEFPYVSSPHRNLMVELASALERRLDSYLLPCSLPPDVQSYKNDTATAHASLYVRTALDSSPIDFILGSWLHCKLPSGGALNITSLSAYMNTSSDAPNLVIEFIQSSPTSLILILDLPPRKDLVLHPDYLNTFYEASGLEKRRQLLEKIPEAQPYFPSSLYIRGVLSPTAILVCIETKADESYRMEEIFQDHVSPVAKEVLGIWLDVCAFGEREVEGTERAYLAKRDQMIKNKTIEIDLGSSLPPLFGEEVADRVLGALRKVFNA